MPDKLIGLFLSALILVSGAFGASKSQVLHHQGIKFRVLHHFTGGDDGCCILGGLARDRKGDLYGVTYSNNDLHGDGLLFKLTHIKSGYRFHVLQTFSRDTTGRECVTTPAPDKYETLFGVCEAGGSDDKGTLWEYSRSKGLILLHSFTGPDDGMSPEDSVALDDAGNIYGTTDTWGPGLNGTLWEYSPSTGTFVLLHSFSDGEDGGFPSGGPRIDRKTGLLWGGTFFGPNCHYCGHGTIWNYDPSSGMFTTVLNFENTEINQVLSRLIVDGDGNVFGTSGGGPGGIVFELQKNNNYNPAVLYQFNAGNDGESPYGRVRFDNHRNLFGTTVFGGDFGCGTAYELTHKNGAWQETILHSFDCTDGYQLASGLKTDHKGNWFGTAAYGGKYNAGTVFEISGVRP